MKSFKRTVILILIVLMAVSFMACGDDPSIITSQVTLPVGDLNCPDGGTQIDEGKDVTYDMKPERDDPTAVSTTRVAEAVAETYKKL